MDKSRGEITAFLCIVIFLVLSLICTIIESARITSGRIFIDRTLYRSMESLFSNYNMELWDNYHLFMLSNISQFNALSEQEIVDEVMKYMNYSIHPSRGLSGAALVLTKYMNLYDIKINSLSLVRKVSFMDSGSDFLVHEAVEYMKYQSPQNLLEKILMSIGLLKSAAKSAEIIESELNAAENMSEVSRELVKLISLVEGISMTDSGIKLTGSQIAIENNFVKQLCSGHITMESTGISHAQVYQALKSKYVDPLAILEQLESLNLEIEESRMNISNLSNELQNPNDFTYEIIDLNMKEKISKGEEKFKKIAIQFNDMIKNTKQKIVEGIQCIEQIEKKRTDLAEDFSQLESKVEKNKDEIGPEIYGGLLGDLTSMKEFISGQKQKQSYNLMPDYLFSLKGVLNHNKMILNKIHLSRLINIKHTDSKIIEDDIKEFKEYFKQYKVKELSFDYNTLKLGKKPSNPVNSLKKLLKEGVMDLILDEGEKVNRNKITINNLPSSSISSTKDNSENIEFIDNITGSSGGNYNKGIRQLFGCYFSNYRDDTSKERDTIVNTVLFNEYILHHFGNIRKKIVGNEEKSDLKTALAYEQEYILNGRDNDYDNLYEIILTTVLLRTVFNFIYLLSDREKSEQALSTASALVGFTCLQPLVMLMKILILVVWALEESLIDTKVLIYGGSIPLLKKRNEFILQYEDLIRLNKSYIKEKAEAIRLGSKNGKEFTYENYMHLFFFLNSDDAIQYRTLDLIQLNLSKAYYKDFKISDGIFGISMDLNYEINSKFMRLPFYKGGSNTNRRFIYSMKKAYSY